MNAPIDLMPHLQARPMPAEAGGGVSMMRRFKRALDPRHVMNPGKVFAN